MSNSKYHKATIKNDYDDDVFLHRHCAVDVLFQMGRDGGEEAEKMSTDTGLELHPGVTKGVTVYKRYNGCS